ncbi:MAG: pantoate--beta-alanine ligase [Planctomycetia bacterium]|nr:pantoate--beta-alanine ligase [Planctomycetia bacterium]
MTPNVVTRSAELRDWVRVARTHDRTIGLVPTMGALHAGHLSLVEASLRECGATVVSIFVNPTQFGPSEDFQRYPRDLEGDLAKLAGTGKEGKAVDLVFVPTVEEMYPEGCTTTVDVGAPAEVLEGAFRPGHFRGVATVVLKLFNQVLPDVAYFGHKDYQQTVVVRRMVEDLCVPVEIRVCPTVREPDGLALSSRNKYLSAEERRQALAISRALRAAADVAAGGERRAEKVLSAMRGVLEAEPGVRVQYAVLVDPLTLRDMTEIRGRALAAIATYVGKTRLIDNIMLPRSSS